MVYAVRERCGRQLAVEAHVEADIVSTVPDSATPAALGYSQQASISCWVIGFSVLMMQRYIIQTIYRVDIGHIVSYQYCQEKYQNFDISLSFRYRFNIGKTTSVVVYFSFL